MATLKYRDPDTGEWKYVDNGSGADKAYVDAQDDSKVDKAGDTMTGPLDLQSSGDAVRLEGSGNELFVTDDTGAALLPIRVADPVFSVNAATKSYVDANYNANGVNTTTDLNTLEDPGLQPNLYGTNNPNSPKSGTYFMVLNFIYNNTEITQFAIPYANVAGSTSVYMRGRYQGNWSAWQAWK